jgi:hypothetical protein
MPPSHEVAFEAFGVPVAVRTNVPDEVIEPLLPPFTRPAAADAAVATFVLEQDAAGGYRFGSPGGGPVGSLQLEHALDALQRSLRMAIALHAPHHVFLHAGAVVHEDRAIVIPGTSFSGKTTLVAALVRAGAVYLSDEFAPLDEHGLVHPFPTPLGVRNAVSVQVDHDVRSFGGRVADRSFTVGAVVLTRYERGATWHPRRKSAGEAALELLEHAVPAQPRPAQTLETIARALENATILSGERGDADALAPMLLGELGSGRAV